MWPQASHAKIRTLSRIARLRPHTLQVWVLGSQGSIPTRSFPRLLCHTLGFAQEIGEAQVSDLPPPESLHRCENNRPTVNGGFLRYSAAHTSTTGLTFSRAFEGRAFFKEVPGDISVIFSESPIANIDAACHVRMFCVLASHTLENLIGLADCLYPHGGFGATLLALAGPSAIKSKPMRRQRYSTNVFI